MIQHIILSSVSVVVVPCIFHFHVTYDCFWKLHTNIWTDIYHEFNLFFLVGYWEFSCVLIRIGNYTCTLRHSSLICWKGIWTDRAGITCGCFRFSYCYGLESPWGIYLCALSFFFSAHGSFLLSMFIISTFCVREIPSNSLWFSLIC